MKPANELRSKFSRYWATSELSCWCLKALRTVAHSRLPSNGLVRKSKAPSRIASTATSTEPWAVITTTEQGSCCSVICCRMSMPDMSGSSRSSSTTGGGLLSSWARACWPQSARSTS